MRLALLTLLAALTAANPLPGNNGKGHGHHHGKDHDKGAERQHCVVPHAGGGDDTPAVHEVVSRCARNAVIEFSAGLDYQILTPVKLENLTDVEIRVEGNLHLPRDMEAVRAEVARDVGLMLTGMRWFSFAGRNVSYVGSSNSSGGWIDGHGQQYWDANPPGGAGIENRPKLIRWELYASSITRLKVRKPPAWVSSIHGDGIAVRDVHIDASTRDGGGFPFNTDGFDVGAHNVEFSDMTILNGDDAIAINNGAQNVTVQRVFMGGPGCHGMSVGSLGRNNSEWQDVRNIRFADVTAVGAVYAARFKSYDGGRGHVSNVTWERFRLQNVTYPIFVTQTYHNQGSEQTQNGEEVKTDVAGQAVMMDGFTWRNFRGSINSFAPGDGSCASVPCWYDVPDTQGTEAIVMTCANDASCKNFVVEDIALLPQNDRPASVKCTGVGAATNPHFGLECTNGTYVPL